MPNRPNVPGSGTAGGGGVLEGKPSANPVLFVQNAVFAAEQTCNSKSLKSDATSVPEIVNVKV